MISYSTKKVSDAWLVFQQEKKMVILLKLKLECLQKKSHIIYK